MTPLRLVAAALLVPTLTLTAGVGAMTVLWRLWRRNRAHGTLAGGTFAQRTGP